LKSGKKEQKKSEIDREIFFADLENVHEAKKKLIVSGAQVSPKTPKKIPDLEIMKAQPYKDQELTVTTIPTQMRKPGKKEKEHKG
jgi:hypothetical protein